MVTLHQKWKESICKRQDSRGASSAWYFIGRCSIRDRAGAGTGVKRYVAYPVAGSYFSGGLVFPALHQHGSATHYKETVVDALRLRLFPTGDLSVALWQLET
jgi:hypothetical protein